MWLVTGAGGLGNNFLLCRFFWTVSHCVQVQDLFDVGNQTMEKKGLVFEEITGVLCTGLRRIGNSLVGAPWNNVYVFADDN